MDMSEPEVVKKLKGIEEVHYKGDYYAHLLEQYKLFVEMTDKISERRQATNNFFVTLNSGIITALGIAFPHSEGKITGDWYIFISVLGVLLCASWYHLIRSYRCLNEGRFEVIHEIEKLLPVRPYTAEWAAVGEGRRSLAYRPFTEIEHNIPWIFAVLFVAIGFVAHYLS